MKCERCREDKTVRAYEIDGYTGYLCDECADAWETVTTSTA